MTDGGGSGTITGALSFNGAYITFGQDQQGLNWAARSTDGRSWETVQLGVMVKPCPAYGAQPDSTVYVGATDGRQVVLAGIEYAMDITPCGTQRAVAWVSSDGRTWQRSEGFGAVRGFAQVYAVWPIPGGWEALVGASTGGPTTIWRSSDGLQWHQATELIPAGENDISANVAAADDGTRVLALFNGAIESPEVVDGLRGGESSLRTSADGLSWDTVDLTLAAGRGVVAGGIVPPGPAGPTAWLLVTIANGEAPITWTSSDLRQWAQGTFPRPELASLAFTRYGYIATGNNLCGDGGGSCSIDPTQYLSRDGLRWAQFTSSVAESVVVDGPAGVLAFSGGGFQVWQLKP